MPKREDTVLLYFALTIVAIAAIAALVVLGKAVFGAGPQGWVREALGTLGLLAGVAAGLWRKSRKS